MKNKLFARFAIAVALSYSTAAGDCQSIPVQPQVGPQVGLQADSQIRFRMVDNTLVVVSLMAGDHGPFDFVLDTGANTTVVDPSLASKLSLATVGHVQQTTLSGVQALKASSITDLSLGPAHVEGLLVLVQDLAQLRKMDSHIEGIVGQNFLSHFNYVLDYRRRLLRIELGDEIRDATDGNRVQIEAGEDWMIDRMIVASDGQSLRHAKLHLLLDSGANSVVLMRTGSEALHLPAQESELGSTSSGQVRLQVGRIHQLTVGSEQFHDIAAALPAVEPTERIGDGLLPTALFESLYVNNREGFVVFNPHARKN